MREALLFRWLPHALQLALVAIWIAGALDVIPYVADLGAGYSAGKFAAMIVLFGPVALAGRTIVDWFIPLGPRWRQWMFTALGAAASLPSAIALLYTRAAFGSWIDPSWF